MEPARHELVARVLTAMRRYLLYGLILADIHNCVTMAEIQYELVLADLHNYVVIAEIQCWSTMGHPLGKLRGLVGKYVEKMARGS